MPPGVAEGHLRRERAADMRYVGQSLGPARPIGDGRVRRRGAATAPARLRRAPRASLRLRVAGRPGRDRPSRDHALGAAAAGRCPAHRRRRRSRSAPRLPTTATRTSATRPPRSVPVHRWVGPPDRPGVRRPRPGRRPRCDRLRRPRLHLPRGADAGPAPGCRVGGVSTPRVDLRSDTLSPSTPAMFEAMAAARIGMASRGEDEHVLRLEARGAELLGTEVAAFLPNVTSANLLALLAQAPRGTAIVMDRMAHINQVEWYGITVFGGTVPWLLEANAGHLDPAAVEERLPRPERRPQPGRRRPRAREQPQLRGRHGYHGRRDRRPSQPPPTATARRSISTARASPMPQPRSALRSGPSRRASTRWRSR